MALDNFRTIELIWDKANKSIIKTIKTASSDTTGRYLSVKILDGGQEVTLNNAKLQLYWEHPNFNTSGTDDFNTVNNGGLFKMTFSDEMLTNVGELNAHLVLTLSDGKITSDGFPIEVIKGADDGVVVPTNGSGLVEQVANKIDKGNVTMGDLTQEVKLAMTGGSVAIVGENAVGTENIKDSAVNYAKLDRYNKEIISKTEGLVGSYADSYIDKKSLEFGDYTSLTSAGSSHTYIVKQPAQETGLLTIHFKSGGEANSNFLILNRTEEPLSSPLAFEIVRSIPFSTTQNDYNTNIKIETDYIIEEGQYLGVENGTRIFLENDGVSSGSYRQSPHDGSYLLTPTGILVYGQVGGRVSVIENIQNQLRNITTDGTVTVKDFGAIGDGVTDDTVALNNAMQTLAGGEVVIPEGDYLVTGTIEIPSNTVVRGVGKSTRLVLGDGYVLKAYDVRRGRTSILANEPFSENIVVRDLAIEGNTNEPLTTNRMSGLFFIDLKGGLVENVHINNINYFPDLMKADSSPDGYNFKAARSENIIIIGGTFTNGGYECLGIFDDCHNVVIDSVYTGSAWRTSLQIHRGCSNIKVINSTINQQSPWASGGLTTHGIEGEEVKDVVIDNNTIYATQREIPEASYNAVLQLMDGGIGESYRVTNNHIRGKRTGIYMPPSKNNVFSGNDIEVETGYGIYVPSTLTDSIITSNIVRAPQNPMHSESTLVINNIGLDDYIPSTV